MGTSLFFQARRRLGGMSSVARQICIMGLVLTWCAPPADAQGLPLIRDAEVEALLEEYARPILKVAGLANRVRLRVVKNSTFNAFVTDGRNIFVNTGMLIRASGPSELSAVIAHHAASIAGGHPAALRGRLAKHQSNAMLSQLLGVGVESDEEAAATSLDEPTGREGVTGQQDVLGSLATERQAQVFAADQAGVKHIHSTQQSGRGMLRLLERFAAQEAKSKKLQASAPSPFPKASDRLARVRDAIEKSEHFASTDPAELQQRHDMMRAKIAGYLDRPDIVLKRYPNSDTSLPARYARALAQFFRGGKSAHEAALAEIDTLIRDKPGYPYLHETKGDLYVRMGKPKDAIPHFREALKLKPDTALIRVQLAAALKVYDSPAEIAESVDLLRKSLIDDPNPRAYRLLAYTYEKQGKKPEGNAMLAQANFHENNLKTAIILAKRALSMLQPGSPLANLMDDIVRTER